MATGLAQYIVGKQILGIATVARTHRQHDERRSFANRFGHLDRHDFDFGSDCACSLQILDRLENLHSRFGGFPDGLEAACPGRPRWNEANMTDDRNSLVSHALYRGITGAAVNGVGTGLVELEGPT